MQDHIRERVLKIAAYLVQHNCTVRQAAIVFRVSKSTVHKDVTERLPRLNEDLAGKVRQVLDQNKAERHLRGGEATRKKYQEKKERRISPPVAE
ncbi:putative DeoR family transcriptional regulator, stage III sporulation protein D [Thermanaeromonas toyohensis ToBE]|uniref:Putative DeoR family transcriptional regulator, stage III sporulation protein D n=1 Tax=Thermanaeromonas toyohensis ToBE TaxID=698762 RepID=A0A1W1V953_9FIRM|nr:sporulation transcriptional regulator SpoIIID [Thermanaeromonas toyohensis]SMB89514.1 putative DeoR family transcriptional regulator, stage III sporulation protein D [Thermanaeromonas toyohensis ToBE]